MKQILFALFVAVVAAVFAFFLWWQMHYVIVGWPPFVGALAVLTVPVLVGMFIWGMRSLGRVAARRWGFGGYSPTMLFAAAFFALMMYSFSLSEGHTFDIQVHDTYFVVENVHAPRGVAILFGLAAAVYFYYPRAIRRSLHRGMGYIHFWVTVFGLVVFCFALTTLQEPLLYAPRSQFQYYGTFLQWNDWGTVALLLLAAGQLVFLINLVYSALKPVERGSEIR